MCGRLSTGSLGNSNYPIVDKKLEGWGSPAHAASRKLRQGWVWCCSFVIPTLGRQRQEDLEFKASLGYTLRLCWLPLTVLLT